MTANYDLVRGLIARTFPEDFADFNERLMQLGGFCRGNPARERQWKTKSGKVQFPVSAMLSALGVAPSASDEMALLTLCSNDKFNTTIYGFSDRLRGLDGGREIVLINRSEMDRLGLSEGQKVALVTAIDDGLTRQVEVLAITPYDLPLGCIAGYYPELSPLVPLAYYEKNSKTPAYKGTPVRIIA